MVMLKTLELVKEISSLNRSEPKICVDTLTDSEVVRLNFNP